MPAYQERKAGIYRSTFTGTEERSFTNPDTSEEEPRWLWKFQEVADPTSVGVIDAITGTSLRSRTATRTRSPVASSGGSWSRATTPTRTSGRRTMWSGGRTRTGGSPSRPSSRSRMPHRPSRMPQEGRRRGKRHRTPPCRICRSSVDTLLHPEGDALLHQRAGGGGLDGPGLPTATMATRYGGRCMGSHGRRHCSASGACQGHNPEHALSCLSRR